MLLKELIKLTKVSRFLSLLIAISLLVNCDGKKETTISINSKPQGARILDNEGNPTSYRTPAIIPLIVDADNPVYHFRIEHLGYEHVDLKFEHNQELDFISPGEALTHICLAPFCLGIPLLRFLAPVNTIDTYEPYLVNLQLKRSGGGLFIEPQFPPRIELIVDGKSFGQFSGSSESNEIFIPLLDGKHNIEIHAEGFEPLTQAGERGAININVNENTPNRLADIRLKPKKSGFYLVRPTAFPLSEIELIPHINNQPRIKRDNFNDQRFFPIFVPAGKYTLKLKGKTFFGKELTHSEDIVIDENNILMKNLKELGDWQNIRAGLGIVIRKDIALDVSEAILTKEFVTIGYVRPGTPAYKSGLRQDDILLSVNGYKISGRDYEPSSINLDLAQLISMHHPGTELSLLVQRHNNLKVIKINSLMARYFDNEIIDAFTGQNSKKRVTQKKPKPSSSNDK